MGRPSTFDEARGRRLSGLLDLAATPGAFVLRRFRPLSAERLTATARALTRLDDFGVPDVVEPLRRYVEGLREEGTLSETGEVLERAVLTGLLTSRLRIVDHLKSHPDDGGRVPRRPIFIIGLPRTGTTLLQHVLADHVDVRTVEGWESFDPLPGNDDARRAAYRRYLTVVRLLVPQLFTVHPMEETGPEEGLEMIDRTLHSRSLAFFGTRGYSDWLEDRTHEQLVEAYGLYVQQLGLLAEQRSGRLLVKSPALLGLRRVLSHHLPDARFVMTHRDLRAVVPSALSLAAVKMTTSRRVDPELLGSRLAGLLGRLAAATMSDDDAVDPARTVDVRYHQLVQDPARTCRELLDRLELGVPVDLDERVEQISRRLRGLHSGRHVYRLAQFGVTDEQLAEIADAYAERFGLRSERVRS